MLLAAEGCARYTPEPVDLAAYPSAYRARRLDDSALVARVGRWAGTPRPGAWTDRQLAVAALELRPEVARARAEWLAARAGERTAGARPSPGAQGDVEHAVSGSEGQSPWVVALAGMLTVELGGKRGARVQRARARTAAAEAELRRTAWRVVEETRLQAAELAFAVAELHAAQAEVEALSRVESLERSRYQEASLASSELARTAGEVQAARVDMAVAEGASLESRARLASAIGVPARAVETLGPAPEITAGCAAADSATPDSLGARALVRRPEMAAALAAYAGAEADVRLAVAHSYPDLDLGPGFIWDQGVHRWTLALSLPNLFGFLNKAPTAEAESARRAEAAAVAETQEQLLAEVQRAVAGCRAARLERDAAAVQVTVADRAAQLADSAYARGETSRLEPALAALTQLRARRSLAVAERRWQRAGLTLEAAGGEWSGGDGWPDPRGDAATEGASR